MMRATSKLLTLAGRVYRLLLYAYPTPFRREYGFDMAQAFRADTHDTFQESGTVGLIGLWLLTFTDLLKTAFAEHIWEVFHMPIEKLRRLSGLAAIGGPLWAYTILWIFFLEPRISWEILVRVLVVVTLLSGLLMGVCLGGLYRRLPTSSHPANRLTFGLSLLGLVLNNTILIPLYVTMTSRLDEFSLIAVYGSFFAYFLGIAGMGLIAMSGRALGRWSFTPLAVGALGLLFIVGVIVVAPREVGGSMAQGFPVIALLALYGISWLLLGIGLWSTHEEPLVREQPA
jgi:hypothetical protein